MSDFFNEQQQSFSYHNYQAKIPLFYRKLSMLSVLFLAQTSQIQKSLPTHRHKPLRIFPGYSLISLQFFEYQQCDIGPYNEIATSVAVHPFNGRSYSPQSLYHAIFSPALHGYVLDLPVNTDASLWGGIEVFNYPKYLANIPYAQSDKLLEINMNDAESSEPILSATYQKPSHPGYDFIKKPVTFFSYPVKENKQLLAKMRIRFGRQYLGSGSRFSMILHAHSRATLLRNLGLSRPLCTLWVPLAEAILYAPTTIGDIS